MNKEGFIRILKHGRKTDAGKIRFRYSWYERKSNNIFKKERATCCYAHYYNPTHDNQEKMVQHCTSNEHIEKLVERLGYEDERLINEVRYYVGKILNQEKEKSVFFTDAEGRTHMRLGGDDD